MRHRASGGVDSTEGGKEDSLPFALLLLAFLPYLRPFPKTPQPRSVLKTSPRKPAWETPVRLKGGPPHPHPTPHKKKRKRNKSAGWHGCSGHGCPFSLLSSSRSGLDFSHFPLGRKEATVAGLLASRLTVGARARPTPPPPRESQVGSQPTKSYRERRAQRHWRFTSLQPSLDTTATSARARGAGAETPASLLPSRPPETGAPRDNLSACLRAASVYLPVCRVGRRPPAAPGGAGRGRGARGDSAEGRRPRASRSPLRERA